MGEITKNSELAILVEDSIFNMGEVSPTDVIPYSFTFNGTADQIEYLEKGCGCTSTSYDEKNNKIVGTLDIQKANGNKEYPNGESSINKYIFVWMNDGQPRFVANLQKQKLLNPKKTWFKLALTGTVVAE
jgi:hypothetical protein